MNSWTELAFWTFERLLDLHFSKGWGEWDDGMTPHGEAEDIMLFFGPVMVCREYCNVLDCEAIRVDVKRPCKWKDLFLPLIGWAWVRGTERCWSSGLHIRGCRAKRWVQTRILLPLGLWEKDW